MEELLQDFADKEVVYSATGEKLRVINSSSLWSVAGPIDYVKNYYPFGTPYSGDALADNPDHYNERGMSYTQNGALTRLLRYGKRNTEDFGLIDSLTITLDGNRVHSVNDGAGNLVYSNSFDFKHSAPKPYENPFIYRGSIYRYDDNGRLTYDPDKRALFSYDQTGNLKRFDRGSVIEYVYSSTGEKLCQFINLLTYAEKPTIFGTDTGSVITTGALPGPKPSNITSHLIYGQDVKLSHQHCTDFTGPFIIYYGKLDKFLFDGGYCTFKDGEVSFHYYQQDHLGNNRAVVSEDGTVEQTTEYYPFGGIYGDVSTNSGLQPYKYNGKEFDHSLGLDLYDYGARLYDPALVVWTGVDPLADECGGISPYVYCGDNPVNAIDPDGKKVIPILCKDNSVIGYYRSPNNFSNAMRIFAKTKFGQQILADFTPKGKTIFGVKGNGKYAEFDLKIQEETYSSQQGRAAKFFSPNTGAWTHAQTSLRKDGNNGKPYFIIFFDLNYSSEELIETIVHEFTVHLSNYEEVIRAYKKNFDFNDAEQVWNSSSAYQEHHDLNNKNKNRWLPGTANYYNTCNEIIKKSPQLKNIFEKTKRENEKKY